LLLAEYGDYDIGGVMLEYEFIVNRPKEAPFYDIAKRINDDLHSTTLRRFYGDN
jgi:hypothetical protein